MATPGHFWNLMEMNDEATVAYHEAGHLVIAHSLGATINGITVEGEQYRNGESSWSGNAHVDCRMLGKDAIAKIALAGPLTDAKFVGTREFAGSRPDFESLLRSACIAEESLPQIRKALLAVCDDTNPDAMNAHVTLAFSGGERARQRIFFGECIGDIRNVRQAVCGFPNGLDELLAAARQLIDDPGHWGRILVIAERLRQTNAMPLLRKQLSAEFTRTLLGELR